MALNGKWIVQRLRISLQANQPPWQISGGASLAGPGYCLGIVLGSLAAQPVVAGEAATQLPSFIRVVEVPSTRVYASLPPIVGINKPPPPMAEVAVAVAVRRSGRADFAAERVSADARRVANWVVNSADNGRRPFVIVDKIEAKVFVFDAQGKLRGAAPVLLGLATGDDTVPGIGKRKLASIRPEERTTPAGRFVASLDRDVHGQEVLWVDYDAAISMHRVVTSNPKERRLQRLSGVTALDRRISYGCINVPAKFYDTVLSPAFKGTDEVVYVLPDTHSISKVFASHGFVELTSTDATSRVEHQLSDSK